MLVDGVTLSERIYSDLKNRLKTFSQPPILAIITIVPNLATQKYLALKQKKAAAVGVKTELVELSATASTQAVVAKLEEISPRVSGLIVQLPLPPTIDVEAVIRAVPSEQDVDALNPSTKSVLPPVAGAFKEILDEYQVDLRGRRVVILGQGRLVGAPARRWFAREGAEVTVLTKEERDILTPLRQADIVVCGAGDPGFLKPEMVREGVIVLDAGTSETGGVLRGDADPKVADKASLFTPVPGGVGPLTIAVLLRNLVLLATKR